VDDAADPTEFGRFGFAADLIDFDYRPPPLLSAELVFGFNSDVIDFVT